MANGDDRFSGAIPESYDKLMVPLLFAPWAEVLADRVAALAPADILETAAGTGVLTRALSKRCPAATITATDLNAEMLEVARRRVANGLVRFLPADALDLPFGDAAFDLAVSQFGMMFYPDRARGFAESWRLLRPGGTMFAATWAPLADNPVSEAVAVAVAKCLTGNPPGFFARVPFSYHDPDVIRADACAGGFDAVEIDRVTLAHPPVAADSAVEALCLGTPMRAEIESHGPEAMARVLAAAKGAMAAVSDERGRVAATMTALIVTARR